MAEAAVKISGFIPEGRFRWAPRCGAKTKPYAKKKKEERRKKEEEEEKEKKKTRASEVGICTRVSGIISSNLGVAAKTTGTAAG